MTNQYKFEIAELPISITADRKLIHSSQFDEFRTEKDADYTALISQVDHLTVSDEIVSAGICYEIIKNADGSFSKQYSDKLSERNIYAQSELDTSEKMIKVEYLEKGIRSVNSLHGAFFHIHWEELMLHENRLILHSCAVQTPYGAILFSGPSGIGKSTQGNLWCRYEGAELLNGDRPVLYKKDRTWTAYGSPYAGSSNCYVNKSSQIRCIVMLKQEKVNHIRNVGMAEAFRLVYSGITVPEWDGKAVGHACDLVMDLIQHVPVYELECTPDQQAVETLKNELMKR